MTRINLSLQPSGCSLNLMRYCGNLTAVITLDRSLHVSDSYTFLLYNDLLMLLDHAKTGDSNILRKGRTLTIDLWRNSVWLTGRYFFLLRSGSGTILRADFMLTDDGTFHCLDTVACQPFSDEDILSGALVQNAGCWRRFTRTPGLMQLKRWAIRRAKVNALIERHRKQWRGDAPETCDNLLIAAPENSGTLAATMLRHLVGIKGTARFAECTTFYDTTRNNPYEGLSDFFQHPDDSLDAAISDIIEKRRIYHFTRIGTLLGTGGKTILSFIGRHLADADAVIFQGTPEETDALLDENPSWRTRFPRENRLQVEPLSEGEMVYAFLQMAEIADLHLSPEATQRACELLSEAHRSGKISGWDWQALRHYVRQHLQSAFADRAIAALSQGQSEGTALTVGPDDIAASLSQCLSLTADATMEKLQSMVGLTAIKQSIATLANRLRFFCQRRQLGLSTTDDAAYHAIFTGNPGTGKTTVARLLGRIYHKLGILSRGEVICADRSRIIGRYIGETEENMRQLLKEARGNILLIDEAYTLYTGGDEKDFGRHAVECLLDVLSRKHPDIVIIFAGYAKQMGELLEMNPGLAGRFPYRFHFPDYSADELLSIAHSILQREQYELSGEAEALLAKTVRQTVARRAANFANARWVEQYLRNGIIPAMADRLASAPHAFTPAVYQCIEAADVAAAYAKFGAVATGLQSRRAVGFSA